MVKGTLLRFRVMVLAMVLAVVAAALPPQLPADASSHCRTSGPSSGVYNVTVCLTAPAVGATLTGDTTVTATVTVAGTSPGVRRAAFYLNGSYVLTDFASPWTFTLQTQKWLDGSYTLEAEAVMQDGFVTQRASIPTTLQNGVVTPPINTNTFTPRTGSIPAPGVKFRVAATGDGAGGRTNATSVVNGIATAAPNLMLYLGDVYEKGSSAEFFNWYGSQGTSFGRFRDITNPTIGNHEYENNVAPGYFDYWDNVPNYYSFNAGGWHFISLNSNSQLNQTSPGSAQYQWLESDLAANTSACTVVYFHHPVLSIGPQGSSTKLQNMWKLMSDWGVDVVLTAHDHNYQRWVPLDRMLNPDPAGITQFVVGGGGQGIQSFVSSDSRVAVGLDSTTNAYGSLFLDLDATSGSFQFVTSAGTVRDSGTVQCSVATSDTSPPTPPSPLSATAAGSTKVDLAWSASTDNYGVTGYTVYRDGAPMATVGGATLNYSDTTVNPSTGYSYTVVAFDAAGNMSVPSNSANVTTTAPPQSIRVVPVADAYVDSSKATTNYGTATTLRADASPDVRSYMRFTVTGVTGPVTKATLRLYSNSTHSTGYRIHGVTDNTWTESGLVFNNAPTYNATAASTSGSLTAGTWKDLDITSLITGNGTYNLAVTTTSSTSLSLASREASTPPELVVDFAAVSNAPPTAGPVTVNAIEDQIATWVPVVSDPDGNPLTCSITAQPLRGSATVATDCSTGTFTPAPDDHGTVSFTYRVADAYLSASAEVEMTIAPVNDAPRTNDQALTLISGSELPISITASDVDGDCPLSFQIINAPAAGTLGPVGDAGCTVGVAAAPVVYTANPGFVGTDSFTFVATDASGASSAAGTITLTVQAAPARVWLVPVADAYVDSSKATTNYGTATTLRADASPDVRSYMRFTVTGVTGPVTKATLRLYSNSTHSTGYRIHGVTDNTWTESGLVFNNAPTYNATAASTSGSLTAGTWKDLDITSLITGNGTYNLAVITTSKTSLSLASRESTSPPELVIDFTGS